MKYCIQQSSFSGQAKDGNFLWTFWGFELLFLSHLLKLKALSRADIFILRQCSFRHMLPLFWFQKAELFWVGRISLEWCKKLLLFHFNRAKFLMFAPTEAWPWNSIHFYWCKMEPGRCYSYQSEEALLWFSHPKSLNGDLKFHKHWTLWGHRWGHQFLARKTIW